MKKYLLGFLAIVLAIGLSSATRPKTAFTFYRFCFIGDPRSSSSVADKTKWVVQGCFCNAVDEVACAIMVDEVYTYVDSIAGIERRVLNTTGANQLIINVGPGFLDTSTYPYVQFYKVTTGTFTPYIIINKSYSL